MSQEADRIGALNREVLQEGEVVGKAYDAQLLARLWPYVRPYRWEVAATLILVFPLFALELAPGWIVKVGLETLFQPTGEGDKPLLVNLFGLSIGVGSVAWLGLLYLLVAMLHSGFDLLRTVLMARTGQRAMRDLRKDTFAHLQRLHLGFFDRSPVGRIVTRTTNDIENVAEMFTAGFVSLVTDFLKMAGFATILVLVDAKLALLTFTVVPFLAVIAILFRFKVREAYRKVRVRIARINTYIQECISGMTVIQLFSHEVKNEHDFDTLNAEHRDAWFQSIRYDSALFSVVELAGRITVAVILASATSFEKVGIIYLFIEYTRAFFLPLRDLSAKYSIMQSSMASCERIFQLLDKEPEVTDRDSQISVLPKRRGSIVFDRVWFRYDESQDYVIRDVSFAVEPGESVAFVGMSGSGKTTLINLVSRLYDVNRGKILIDGVDLRDYPQSELRSRIASVLQDVFLFSGTVAENISLRRTSVTDLDIREAAKSVNVHRMIEALPAKYSSKISERGASLSLGQRQLISFARALVHGSDILALDEATSSIDAETERLLQSGVQKLMSEKTSLVVAHRLSTVEEVDRIYVLHHGQIVEAGGHYELLERGGIYQRLYRLQFAS